MSVRKKEVRKYFFLCFLLCGLCVVLESRYLTSRVGAGSYILWLLCGMCLHNTVHKATASKRYCQKVFIYRSYNNRINIADLTMCAVDFVTTIRLSNIIAFSRFSMLKKIAQSIGEQVISRRNNYTTDDCHIHMSIF